MTTRPGRTSQMTNNVRDELILRRTLSGDIAPKHATAV